MSRQEGTNVVSLEEKGNFVVEEKFEKCLALRKGIAVHERMQWIPSFLLQFVSICRALLPWELGVTVRKGRIDHT